MNLPWSTSLPRDKIILAYAGNNEEPQVLKRSNDGNYTNILSEEVKKEAIKMWVALPLERPSVSSIPSEEFFSSVASGLHDLWPAGEKDGKYPWRDSVTNLTRRLKVIWRERQLTNYSVDDCLTAGRRYLAQYEDNTKYMQTLRYFIFRVKSFTSKDGKSNSIYESKFADFLEGSYSNSSIEEWNEAFEESTTYDTGVLI